MPNEGKIFRIIDANINRATEGLRVVEEICRFILEDEKLTLAVKNLRGDLLKIIRKSDLIRARRAGEDVGRKLYTKIESQRSKVEDVFQANIKRTQQAVRCLEEFSKLIDPKLGNKFKAIRFMVYDLEKEAASRLSRYLKLDFDLYVISDSMRDHVKMVREVVAGGAKIVQLRDKNASKKQLLKWAKHVRRITGKAGVIFIINDFVDLAREADADGVHLGQDDLSVAKARRQLGPEKIIGVSVHNFGQALKAEREGADYIAVGPIFSTPTKPQAQPVGLGLLKKVIQKVKIPVVAIGGIDQFNIRKILKTGCRRVAVVRAAREIRELKQQFED